MNDLLHQLGQGIQFHIFIDLLTQIYTVQYQNLQNTYFFQLVNPFFLRWLIEIKNFYIRHPVLLERC